MFSGQQKRYRCPGKGTVSGGSLEASFIERLRETGQLRPIAIKILRTRTPFAVNHIVERTSPAMIAEFPDPQLLENNGQRAPSIYRLPSHRHL